MRKTHDLLVKTGSYTDQAGATKNRYINAGRVMIGDDGSEMWLINRTFNPAGVPDLTGKGGDAVLLRKFEVRNNDQAGAAVDIPMAAAPRPAPRSTRSDPIEDDMPF